jgi:hypothetical protein
MLGDTLPWYRGPGLPGREKVAQHKRAPEPGAPDTVIPYKGRQMRRRDVSPDANANRSE